MLDWLFNEKNKQLADTIEQCLPVNYNFEITKILSRLAATNSNSVCLQFPEGLIIFSETIAQIIEEFGKNIEHVVILGDVTYGACCIDDIGAQLLCCDFLVHFGHSCLIPINNNSIKFLYVFVSININAENFLKQIKNTVPLMLSNKDNYTKENSKIALLSTIQYTNCLHTAYKVLDNDNKNLYYIPQIMPLSAGEVLGCTSPIIDAEIIIFIADGRFHIESAMIQNPKSTFYRFDPVTNKMYKEKFNHDEFYKRRNSVLRAAKTMTKFIILLSTLGRQGSISLAEHCYKLAIKNGFYAKIVVINELVPNNLKNISNHVFLNIGCPRMCYDWGVDHFEQPFISSYEFITLIKNINSENINAQQYSMDYFAAKGVSSIFCHNTVVMRNEAGQFVDLYIPRKCSFTNKNIHAKEHGSVQFSVAHVDEKGVATSNYTNVILSENIRRSGEADKHITKMFLGNNFNSLKRE